jgi:hypothetical protein
MSWALSVRMLHVAVAEETMVVVSVVVVVVTMVVVVHTHMQIDVIVRRFPGTGLKPPRCGFVAA